MKNVDYIFMCHYYLTKMHWLYFLNKRQDRLIILTATIYISLSPNYELILRPSIEKVWPCCHYLWRASMMHSTLEQRDLVWCGVVWYLAMYCVGYFSFSTVLRVSCMWTEIVQRRLCNKKIRQMDEKTCMYVSYRPAQSHRCECVIKWMKKAGSSSVLFPYLRR